jgi:hypothetical protein
MRLIKKTYEVITPESAREGDAAERGWEDEAGTEITPDELDLDEAEGDELAAVVSLVVKHIGQGVEASDYPSCAVSHTWYTDADPDRDYSTGAETYYSYHLSGFTMDEELAIYAALTGRTVKR